MWDITEDLTKKGAISEAEKVLRFVSFLLNYLHNPEQKCLNYFYVKCTKSDNIKLEKIYNRKMSLRCRNL